MTTSLALTLALDSAAAGVGLGRTAPLRTPRRANSHLMVTVNSWKPITLTTPIKSILIGRRSIDTV